MIEVPAETLEEMSDRIADEYGVSKETMRFVVDCESDWNPEAVGDQGHSHGLVQIHLPSHRSITKELAQDPEFALRFLAGHLKEGRGDMWTCFRKMSR